MFRLGHQEFSLGDRIISIVDFGNIPLGAKGTVVGAENSKVDVCWDYPLMFAGDLDGLCSQNRGSSVGTNTVLNLTAIQPPLPLDAPKKTSKYKPVFRQSSQPAFNQWGPHGIPTAPSQQAEEVEFMLKNRLQIDPNNQGVYLAQPNQAWQPPPLLDGNAPQFLNSNAAPFIPGQLPSFDQSWRPPVPIIPAESEELSNQLLSILHKPVKK